MANHEIITRSSYLTTKDKHPARLLSAGKVSSEKCGDKCFLFYLIEIVSQWNSSAKVKKTITDTLQKCFDQGIVDEKQFESTLNNVNESLNKLAESGENSWLGNLNAVIGFIYKEEIYLAQTGSIFGYIFRKNKISSLTDSARTSTSPHPLKTFIDITEGRLIPYDKLVFGNTELFNHLSLDRIRTMIDKNNGREAMSGIAKLFKKNKIFDINSIIIEAFDLDKFQNEPLLNMPEVVFIDNPDDTFIKNVAKYVKPRASKFYKTASHQSKIFTKKLIKGTKIAARESKEKWDTKYGPRTKKFVQKSAPALNRAFNRTKEKIGPSVGRFKTKNYSSKNNKITTSLLSFFEKTYFVIRNCIALLLKKENKKYLYLTLIFLFIFFGYLKIRANNSNQAENKEKQEIALSYDRASETYNQAKEDLALGRTNSVDKLKEALDLAKKAQENAANKDKAIALTKEIQLSIDELTKMIRVYNPTKTSLGENVKKIIIVGSDIYGFNTEGKIFLSNTGKSDSKLVASIGTDKGTISSLAFSDSQNLIYISTNQNKILSFDISTKTIKEEILSDNSSDWESSQAIANYVSNLYILDSEGGKVWKHSQSENTFSEGSSYLNTTNLPIRGSVDIAIDGNIYILQNNGGVTRFSKGIPDANYSLKNIPAPNSSIENPAKIFTSADTNYLYILDKKQNRIIKFDKSGEFNQQFTLENIEIEDFVINDKIKKMWALSSGNIYEISYE